MAIIFLNVPLFQFDGCSDKTSTMALKCALCEKQFQKRLNLLQHRRVHNDGRPYQCLNQGCIQV